MRQSHLGARRCVLCPYAQVRRFTTRPSIEIGSEAKFLMHVTLSHRAISCALAGDDGAWGWVRTTTTVPYRSCHTPIWGRELLRDFSDDVRRSRASAPSCRRLHVSQAETLAQVILWPEWARLGQVVSTAAAAAAECVQPSRRWGGTWLAASAFPAYRMQDEGTDGTVLQ